MIRGLLGILLLLGLTGTIIGWLLQRQQADPSYAPQIAARTWASGGPLVAIDDAHWNGYTAQRGYTPFVKLLRSDGYSLMDHGNVATHEILDTAKIIVIANAYGFRGVVRQVGQVAGLPLDALAADALSEAEVARIDEFVRHGGSLLLVADHTPAGRAMQSLASAFQVTMHDGFVADDQNSEGGEPTHLVFTRERRTLGSHPITNGRSRAEAVNKVVTFTGQGLEGPRGAVKLLALSPTAVLMPTRSGSSPDDHIPAAGLAQALAMNHGRGRVVILGDGAVVTSQLLSVGGTTQRVGLQWPGSDNERFARHIMRWLSRAPE